MPPFQGYDCIVVYYLPVFPDQASIALGSRPVGLRTFERHPPPGGLCRPHGLRFADFSASLPSALVWPSPRMIKPPSQAPFAHLPRCLVQLFLASRRCRPGRCFVAVTATSRRSTFDSVISAFQLFSFDATSSRKLWRPFRATFGSRPHCFPAVWFRILPPFSIFLFPLLAYRFFPRLVSVVLTFRFYPLTPLATRQAVAPFGSRYCVIFRASSQMLGSAFSGSRPSTFRPSSQEALCFLRLFHHRRSHPKTKG